MNRTWASEPKFTQSLENLALAFAQLEEFVALPVQSNIERAGVIKAFEFTYEAFWKTFQKAAQSEGIVVVTPDSYICQYPVGVIW